MKLTAIVARLIGAILAIVVFSSCSRNSGDPGPKPGKTLTILCWSDYFPADVLADFTEKTGISIDYQVYDSTNELEGRLASTPDAFDIVVTDDHTISGMMPMRLFAKLDHSRLTNLKHLDDSYSDLWFDPKNAYSVPYLWGTTLLIYNSKVLGDEIEPSWSLLWNQELLGDQKIYMVNETFDFFSAALLKDGNSLNGADAAAISQAASELVRQAELMNVTYADVNVIREMLESGEGAAALLYSGDALMAAEENEDLTVVIPKEGALMWIDNLLISSEAKNWAGAHLFIDYILEPKVAAACANYAWTATANHGAEEHLEAELLADPAVYPTAEVLERCEFLSKEDPDRARQIHSHLHRLKSVIRDAKLAQANVE